MNLNFESRRIFALMSLACTTLLVFGLYLQHVRGLEPCPMCIVQRYVFVSIAILAGLTALACSRALRAAGATVLLLGALFGAFVAARQSWLQWYPPQTASCGRDFYGMVEIFPLSQLIPMIFKGSGDCTQVDWTFLSLSIANWSFLCFGALAVVNAACLWRCFRRCSSAA